jgi:hypothetical protein
MYSIESGYFYIKNEYFLKFLVIKKIRMNFEVT